MGRDGRMLGEGGAERAYSQEQCLPTPSRRPPETSNSTSASQLLTASRWARQSTSLSLGFPICPVGTRHSPHLPWGLPRGSHREDM